MDITGKGITDVSAPLNKNAIPPGHSTQQAAAAAAAGAVAASASRVGVTPVDSTDSAVRLETESEIDSPPENSGSPVFDTVSGQTIDITGACCIH